MNKKFLSQGVYESPNLTALQGSLGSNILSESVTATNEGYTQGDYIDF